MYITLVLPLRDFRAMYLHWPGPFSTALLFYPIHHLCWIGKHITCHDCEKFASHFQYPNFWHHGVHLWNTLKCFYILLYVCLSVSWIWREAVVGRQISCQDVVAWGYVVTLGVVHWCLRNLCSECEANFSWQWKAKRGLVGCAIECLEKCGDDIDLQHCKTSLLSFIYTSICDM